MADAWVDEAAVAERLLRELDVQHPSEIEVELIAYVQHAYVVYRPSELADARVVRVGAESYLAVAEHARGTPRARFSVAHELGHHLLHPDANAIERIHGGAGLDGRAYRLEAQANRFASHLLMPSHLAAEHCQVDPPTLDHVGAVAKRFNVSLTVACQRWTELSSRPCALVEAGRGKIKRAFRSATFRGQAVRGRALEAGTMAREVPQTAPAAPRVHSVAWGSVDAGVPVVEECAPLSEWATLVWLWHGD